MNRTSALFVGLLGSVLAGSMYLSTSGASLPGPEGVTAKTLSLRNVRTRRTHFVRHFVHGK